MKLYIDRCVTIYTTSKSNQPHIPILHYITLLMDNLFVQLSKLESDPFSDRFLLYAWADGLVLSLTPHIL